jgi:rod shape-determining protein MreD
VSFIFHSILWLAIVVFQTAFTPNALHAIGVYDLVIPLVVYIALFRPLREGAALVGLIGLTMEGLSGGPFGIYITTYYWSFAILKWLIGFFNVQSTFLIPFIVAACVVLQNLVVIFMVFLGGGDIQAVMGNIRHLSVQVLWAIPTGPVFLVVLQHMQERFDQWAGEWWNRGEA